MPAVRTGNLIDGQDVSFWYRQYTQARDRVNALQAKLEAMERGLMRIVGDLDLQGDYSVLSHQEAIDLVRWAHEHAAKTLASALEEKNEN